MAKKRKRKESSSSLLEIEESEVVEDLSKYSLWLHGLPKTGKTSLANKFGNCLFGMTEKGEKAQKLNKVSLYTKTWEDYLLFPETVRQSGCDTVVVDVLEKALDRCFNHMKEKTGIEVPEGDDWNVLRNPFIDWVYELLNLEDQGCILISHASSKEVKNSLGEKIDTIHPALTGKPLSQIEGEVDIIAYIGYINGHRVIQLLGDEYVFAGHRLDHAFIDTEGDKLKYVPMGKSATEAHENFIRAFENEQSPKHLHHIFPPKEASEKKTFRKKKK